MKRLLGVILAGLCCLLCSCTFFGSNKSLKETAAERLQLSLEGATVLEEWDTHGARGDGESFLKLSCAEGFEKSLGVETKDWKPLPLQGDAYRYFYEWGGVFEHPDSGEKIIPEVENGYWYFKSTGAMNWEFALFDCEENILYFYVWDA